jgi:hypothetical protein
MTAVRTSIAKQFGDEQIELAYAPLFAHRPDIYDQFRAAIASTKKAEDEFFLDLLEESQKAIFGLPGKLQFPSPHLHDKLLDISSYMHRQFATELASILDEIRLFLKGIVTATDEQLVTRTQTDAK